MCKPRVFVLFFLVLLISGCGPKGGKAPQVIPQKPIWTPVSLPFRPRNISAVGRTSGSAETMKASRVPLMQAQHGQ